MEDQKFTKMLQLQIRQQIIRAQRSEVTEYHIYKKLSRSVKNQENSKVMNAITDDELRHYKIWMNYTGREVEPSCWDMIKFYWISRLFGLTFGLKLMEKGEEKAQINYKEIERYIPEAIKIGKEEGALKSAIFTGFAYINAVVFLVVPYLIFSSPWLSLGVAVADSVFLVFLFTYYISVANDQPFRKRFFEMVILSTVVGLILFVLGYLARLFFGIDV